LVGLSAVTVGAPARAQSATEGAADANTEIRARQQVRAASAEYLDRPQWRVAPAAGAEFGYGTVYPSLHTASFALHGRIGVALQSPDNWTIVLTGQSGLDVAFNTGSLSPQYGYLIRLPLDLSTEAIYSMLIDYRHRRYLNMHLGLVGGPELLLAASCNQGDCKYVQPNMYWGVGPRVGLSYSAQERSSVGLFVHWHSDFASCPPDSGDACATWLSTLGVSLGWTAF
jgi:hypothetical protein